MIESEAIALMTRLAAFYPSTPDATVLAYASEIVRYDQADVHNAVRTLVRSSDRLPTLRQLLVRIRDEQEPKYRALPVAEREALQASAATAWGRLRLRLRNLPAQPYALPPTSEVDGSDEIAFNPEEVEIKREAARAAARELTS